METERDIAGQTIAITGGAGVLGAAMTRALVGRGAHVIILTRRAERAEPLIASLREEGAPGTAQAMACDVTNREQLEQVLASLKSSHARLDGLINAAGGNQPGATTRPDQSFFDLPPEALSQVFDANCLGTLLPCQVFGRWMAEQRAGSILNIASMAGMRPLTRIPAYSAAKAAIVNLTQWLAVHMAQEYSPNIRVNAIAPGFFLTEQNRFLLLDAATGAPTARGQSILAHTPMQRYGEPEELVGAVLWLLSSSARFVTGVTIPIDGGFSAFAGV